LAPGEYQEMIANEATTTKTVLGTQEALRGTRSSKHFFSKSPSS
jgi:hypothetical protein